MQLVVTACVMICGIRQYVGKYIYKKHIFKKREQRRDKPPDWLCHQRALIRRAGPQQQELRLCRWRNTEERLEHKHLPRSPCFPLASGRETVLQTHSSDTHTHTHTLTNRTVHTSGKCIPMSLLSNKNAIPLLIRPAVAFLPVPGPFPSLLR